jgi:hypothetical protein
MKAQVPAEGILKRSDFGDSKFYQVVCGCGQDYHDHTVEVEAADTGINVNIYATAKTNYWSETVKKRFDIDNTWQQEFDWLWKDLVNGLVTRLKVTWQLWTTGAVKVETTIAMSEQQALNYAETLKSAIKDVKQFQQERTSNVENKQALKAAANQDCV